MSIPNKGYFFPPLCPFVACTYCTWIWSMSIWVWKSTGEHLWGICGEKGKRRETSIRVSKHHLMVYWNAGGSLGVWGNVLSPGPTRTHWSSTSHWPGANDGPLPWPIKNGAVKVGEWVQLSSLPVQLSSGQTRAVTGWYRERGPQTNV